MKIKKHTRLFLLLLFVSCVLFPIFGQLNQDSTLITSTNSSVQDNGFLSTFVRTPFILFCFVGTITGVIFSAIIEFVVNIFSGFNHGYPNAYLIWDLGWNQLIGEWYWTPSVWWHVLISVIVWSPLLKRKRSKE